MELNGKKIIFLGDSITEGVGAGKDGRYPTLIERDCDAVCYNHGISGTRIARQQKPADPPSRMDLDFNLRAQDMEPDADVVIVFGGTNDYGHGDAPMGTPADRTPDTFYGAMHSLVNTLLTRYPTAKLLFLTPLHRADETRTVTRDGESFTVTLKEYVDVMREVLEFYGIPVLDLYANGGMNPQIPAMRETYVPDGLHPNAAGHRLLADRIIAHFRANY